MKQGTRSRQWTFEEALALVCDASQPLSRAAVSHLSGAGRAEVSRFADCWRQMPPERRRDVIAAMVEMAESDFELDYDALFRWALQSDDARVRELAIEGLWEDDQPSLIEPLVRMMKNDPDEAVRARAAMSLGRFALLAELGDILEERAARVRDSLLEVIQHSSEAQAVRRRAIESVAYLSDAPVREIIDEAYASPDEAVRISAVFAMGRTADPYWGEPVRNELKSPNPAMRYEAARAAGEIALRSATHEVIALLNDPDLEVQQAAVWALGQIGGAHARRALEVCQRSPSEAIREAAEEALSELDFASGSLDLFRYEGETESDVEAGKPDES